MKIKCPKGETIWVSYIDKDGNRSFIMTSKPSREFYTLWRVERDGSLTKMGRDKSPIRLEEKYKVW